MKTTPVRIEHLGEHQTSIPIVAGWCFGEWGHLSPDSSLEQTLSRFSTQVVPGVIPETLVALDGDRVVGTASIVENDLSSRPELSPWMASVYVDDRCRGQGVGSQIVHAVVAEASALGVDRLYLITHDRMSFYRRFGWIEIERVSYRGEDVTIMFIDPVGCVGKPMNDF